MKQIETEKSRHYIYDKYSKPILSALQNLLGKISLTKLYKLKSSWYHEPVQCFQIKKIILSTYIMKKTLTLSRPIDVK